MKDQDTQLWDRIRQFYKEVRNPLFHRFQLHCPTADQMIPLFDLLNDIYGTKCIGPLLLNPMVDYDALAIFPADECRHRREARERA